MFRECVICKAERDEKTLDSFGVCPFCADNPPEEPPEPKKTNRKRTTRVKIEEPTPPAPEPAPAESSEPYTPPVHIADADPQRELANRMLCRRRLLPFIKRFRPKYMPGWVHEDICRRLERFVQQVAEKKSPRLLLMMPPRSGKSEIGSRHFPPWVLGQFPDWEIIAASHTSSLTFSFSRYIRDLLRDPAYQQVFSDTQLDPTSQSVENWNLTSGGGYLAAGVGTGITGRGAHILLLDDLVKDIEAADSPTISENTWEWYGSTAYTRLAPGGGVLGIMCMTGDTQVTMADGSRRRLDEIRVGEKVLTYGDNGVQSPNVVAAVTSQGVDDIFELKTGNSTVRANARHPFLTQNGWVRLGDLRVGDRLIVSREEAGAEGERVLEDETIAWLLGVMFGDGWAKVEVKKSWDKLRCKHYTVRRGFVGCAISKDDFLTEQIQLAYNHTFGHRAKIHKGAYALRSDHILEAEWFIEHGLDGTAHTKRLPVWLYSEPLEIRKAFLRGFCAADGHVALRKGKLTPRMSINLCNLNLLNDIRHLARSVGLNPTNVSTQVRVHQPPGSPNPVEAYMHNVQWQHEQYSAEQFGTAIVRSITPAGRVEVFDLSVENTHNFIADGIVSHNTWWSEDDWAGRIQATMESGDGEQFEIVKYPAINEEGDEYILPDDSIQQFGPNDDPPPEGARQTRPMGTALHPARYDTDAMLRIKKNLIATGQKRVWQALYQQNPVPDDGLFFTKEMFKLTPSLPARHKCHVFQAWDFAISTGKESDYTVGTTLFQDENDELYVIDVRRFRSADANYIIDTILDYALEYKHERSMPLLGFEDGQIWKTMQAQFEKRCAERGIYPSYEVLKPLTDKQVRAHPLRGRMQAGKIWFLHNTPWYHDLYTEMTRFPAGKHDDQIDSLAWNVRLTLGRAAPRPAVKPQKLKSWKDKLRGLISGKVGTSHMAA